MYDKNTWEYKLTIRESSKSIKRKTRTDEEELDSDAEPVPDPTDEPGKNEEDVANDDGKKNDNSENDGKSDGQKVDGSIESLKERLTLIICRDDLKASFIINLHRSIKSSHAFTM